MIAMPVCDKKKMAAIGWRIRVWRHAIMNVGTIVEAPMLKVRLTRPKKGKRPISGGRVLGEMEEYFLTALAPGDTFVFAGETLRLEAVRDSEWCRALIMPTRKCRAIKAANFPFPPIWPNACAPCCLSRKVGTIAAASGAMVGHAAGIFGLPNKDTLLVESFARGALLYDRLSV